MAVSSTTGGLKTGVCLSTDRPDNPFNGQVIYETDTNRTLVWDNSAWVVIANASSTGFPTSLDTNTVDSIAALQAKVGINSSAVTSSHDYKIADHASRLTTLEAASTGKILQIVRDTDTTTRTTTSTSFVDITGVTVTITPTSATSNIIVVFSGEATGASASINTMQIQITDSSNVALSGAEGTYFGNESTTVYPYTNAVMIGYASPASTSAQTYKARFRSVHGGTQQIRGAVNTTQLFAIEVGA